MNIRLIVQCLDNYLTATGQASIGAVEANHFLEKAGLLADREEKKGLPLRKILRKGLMPHAYQLGGKGSTWVIPHSGGKAADRSQLDELSGKINLKVKLPGQELPLNFEELRNKLEAARLKYKPVLVKYLLIAEAPPDSIDRFFYYDKVKNHDHLFLGVSQALFPGLKESYLRSGRDPIIKDQMLKKFQNKGFFLLDLSELPLTYLKQPLQSQLPELIKKSRALVQSDTMIILIKSNVYDAAFSLFQQEFGSRAINCRIPFPGQGHQLKFQEKFAKALEMAECHLH